MDYSFFTCDVFTAQRFGGNPLAVLPDAVGLNTEQMQAIAREFNYSETTFVLPPEHGGTRKVRIFNTTQELPFAGHPNIGTAFVLAENNLLDDIGPHASIIFEESAGLVPFEIERLPSGAIRCELKAPASLQIGCSFPVDQVARMVSVLSSDIDARQHEPRQDGDFSWRVTQVVEMQRPNVIDARCTKRRGVVESVWIAGQCISVSRGHISAG